MADSTLTPTFSPGQCVHGFRFVRGSPLPGLRAIAFELEHLKSGARLLHVQNADAETSSPSPSALHRLTTPACLISWNTPSWAARKSSR